MQTSECSAVVRQTTNPEHYAGAVWPFRQPTRRHRCSSTAASCKLHHFQQYRLKRRMCTRLLSGCPSRISAWKTHQNLPRGGALLDGGYGQRSPARGRRHRLTRALLANWPCPPAVPPPPTCPSCPLLYSISNQNPCKTVARRTFAPVSVANRSADTNVWHTTISRLKGPSVMPDPAI